MFVGSNRGEDNREFGSVSGGGGSRGFVSGRGGAGFGGFGGAGDSRGGGFRNVNGGEW